MEYILKTHDLSKVYKGQYALYKVNMHIKKGDIYGFVGENGSGKTTIIRLITGLIFPTYGNYELFGVPNTDPKVLETRKKVGAIVESPSIYMNFSARDNLKLQCDLLNIKDEKKIKEVLKEVGLEDLYNNSKRAADFSLGMRQRLGIAMTLLSDPEFLILDEPMNGLDPSGIVDLRELILKLNKERNITFLISSHILNELSLVATTYGIISKGQMVTEISSEDLQKECKTGTIINVDDVNKLCDVINNYFEKIEYSVLEKGVKIMDDINLNQLLSKIIEANINIISVSKSTASIESYYLSLIGGKHHA